MSDAEHLNRDTPIGVEGGAKRGAEFRVPPIARAVVRMVRLVPAIVALAFAGGAVGAALAGEWTTVAAALPMGLLAMSVVIRSAIGGRELG